MCGNGDRVGACKYHAQLHNTMYISLSFSMCARVCVCDDGDRVGACKYHAQLYNTMYISVCVCVYVCVCTHVCACMCVCAWSNSNRVGPVNTTHSFTIPCTSVVCVCVCVCVCECVCVCVCME